ncbi:MAG: methyltransferase domain-containing protein, partial [SAR202 cluster bacterium]|nr:methyltransferase domain-containing protein [SAR202 cluster bacterium]
MVEWNMDRWKYFDITSRDQPLGNPLSIAKLDEIIALLDLNPGDKVLDVACGNGEMLVRIVERYGARGVGLDLSPYVIKDAELKKAERAPNVDLQFIEIDGAKYQPEDSDMFDIASCIGASWIWQGYRGTLRALKDLVTPGGLVAVGEPHWLQPPHLDYLASEGFTAD